MAYYIEKSLVKASKIVYNQAKLYNGGICNVQLCQERNFTAAGALPAPSRRREMTHSADHP